MYSGLDAVRGGEVRVLGKDGLFSPIAPRLKNIETIFATSSSSASSAVKSVADLDIVMVAKAGDRVKSVAKLLAAHSLAHN